MLQRLLQEYDCATEVDVGVGEADEVGDADGEEDGDEDGLEEGDADGEGVVKVTASVSHEVVSGAVAPGSLSGMFGATATFLWL